MEVGMAGVADFSLRIAHVSFKESAVLQGLAHQLHVVIELGSVVGFGKQTFEKDGVRHAYGPEKMHGLAQLTAFHVLVAHECNAADFYLWSFADYERKAYRRRRNRPDFSTDCRELVSVLGLQITDDDFRLFHFGGVVLRFRREGDFILLEAVEDVAFRDRVNSDVIDLSYSRLLFYINMKDPAFGGSLALKANVLEIPGVPQRVEVALDCRLIINIARAAENMGTHTLGGDAAGSVDLNPADNVRLLLFGPP